MGAGSSAGSVQTAVINASKEELAQSMAGLSDEERSRLQTLLESTAPAQPSTISEVRNDAGQPIVRINHGSGSVCEVYLYGATVTKFVSASGRDVLWVSSTAKLDGTKPIRGGIPLVFPQFGQPIKEMPQHGFARNSTWTVSECADSSVTLTLDSGTATHEAWPHPYRLELLVTLCAESLMTKLIVNNTGDAPFEFMDLQHTYFNIGDISQTSVSGFQGSRFLDKTSSDPEKMNDDARQIADVDQFVDRVYVPMADQPLKDPLTIISPLGNLLVHKSAVSKSKSGTCELLVDIVMWNPWAEKAQGMGDFDDEGYKCMLCVEPGLVSCFQSLAPGGSVELTQIVETIVQV